MAIKFLTKFPIVVSEKRHDRVNAINGEKKQYKEHICRQFTSRYGYFAVDRANNVNFMITLVDLKKGKNIIVKISKQHVYDSLLLFLQHRPIKKSKKQTEQLYIKDNKKLVYDNNKLYNDTIENIKKRYYDIKNDLEGFIADTPNENMKRRAELQLNRLLEQQWKMELLGSIDQSEQVLKKISISEIESKTKKIPAD